MASWTCSADCFIYSFVIQVISEKTLCSTEFTGNLRDIFTSQLQFLQILLQIRFDLLFVLFYKAKELGFQQVASLVTRYISAFCLERVALYFKAMPNSINFYKGIFIYIVPVRIIVPWSWVALVSSGFPLLTTLFSKIFGEKSKYLRMKDLGTRNLVFSSSFQ